MFQSHFSFRRATGSVSELVTAAKGKGFDFIPIADYNSTFAWPQLRKQAEKQGVKAIYGVALNVCIAIQAKKPIYDLWRFYAIDDMQPLNELIDLAFSQQRSLPFVGPTPFIKYDQIKDVKNVLMVAGYKSNMELVEPQENLFFGLSAACSTGYVNKCLELGHPPFAMQQQAYIDREDEEFYQISCGAFADVKTYPQWLMDDKEWKESVLSRIDSDEALAVLAIQNRDVAFNACTATLQKADIMRPKGEMDLRAMCIEGAAKIGVDLSDPVYAERLETELKVIQDKKFDDYFFVVADIMNWAHENIVAGPGRGSSAGSLVCYLLGITKVDPIKHGLLFFRFLDPSRSDWPDIDSDVSNRDVVIDYLTEKYGRDHVCKLGSVGTFQATGATNEVSKQLLLPRFEFDKLLSSLPDYAAGDSRADKALEVALNETKNGQHTLAKYPKFYLAGRLSGNPSNAATHAGGVILTNEKLSKYLGRNMNTVMCDLAEAEDLGLIKIDVLGLSTLDIFDMTLKFAGLPRNFLDTIPMDDQKTFDVFNQQKFVGLFQYEGPALKQLTSKIVVDSFDDIAVISALARPGALSSGAAETWARRKMGEPVTYPHEALKPYLEETLGVMAYQETIMLIAHDVAGMGWDVVSKIRKAIGKSMGPEAMREYGDPFISGLMSKGVPQDVAEKFWSDILGAGSYMFNKSHSVAYGLVSYQSAYLKAHYPLEFAAAVLSKSDSHDKQLSILRELKDEGVDYIPFDPDLSVEHWRVSSKDGKKVLIGPLSSVHGLGPKKVQQILAARARKEPLPESIQKIMANAKTDLDTLTPIRDAISKMPWKTHATMKPTPLDKIELCDSWQNYTIIGRVSKCEERSENEERKIQDRIARGQQGFLDGDPKSIEIRLDNDILQGFFCKVTAKSFDDFKDIVLDKLTIDKSIVLVEGSMVPNIPCFIVKKLVEIGKME